MMITKVCTKCGVEKPLSEYHKKKGGRYGLTSRCKICKRQEDKEYRGNNLEKMKEYQRLYWLNNHEKLAEKNRRWQDDNPEKHAENNRRWQVDNPEKMREYRRKWATNNPEKARESRQRNRGRLMTSYIKTQIRNQYNIDTDDITPETIEMKRRSLKYYRELNQLKKLTK